jgi:hypothetical protein
VLPPPDSDEFIFRTHRFGDTRDDWQAGARHLQSDIEEHMEKTREFLNGPLGLCEGRLDGLLCSCNARPQKALVGHAQWETI